MTETEIVGVMLALFFALLGLAILVIALNWSDRFKTKKYRKQLTDLIVVGKLRQYAQKEKVDVYKELDFVEDLARAFKSKEPHRELDKVIEDQIIEETETTKKK